MNQRHNLLVVIGTYNEIDNLPGLLQQIWEVVPSANVLVVDDDSPDGTGEWCEQQRRLESRLHAIHRHDQRGLGSAIIAGMNWGIAHGYELLATMDADHSHSPAYLTALIAKIHGANDAADVVVGSRYCPGGSIVGWPWYRRLSSRVLNSATSSLLGIPASDTSGNYRLYRSCVLAPDLLARVHCNGYGYLEELLWLLDQSGAAIDETPIQFVNRSAGESKISPLEPFKKLAVLLRLAVSRRRYNFGAMS